LLHPFMPFITEEIWQHLPHVGETIMLSQWPQSDDGLIDESIEKQMELTMEVIRAIRNIRSEMNVPLGKKADVIIAANSEKYYHELGDVISYITNLATIETLTLVDKLAEKPEQAVTAVVHGIEIYMPLKGLVDMEKEIARLEKEVEKMNGEIKRIEGKLNNQGFVAKAPADVIEKEKEKLEKYMATKEALLVRLAEYKG